MNHDELNETPGVRHSRTTKASQPRPDAGFGLRVAVLAGVVISAGLLTANLSTPVSAVANDWLTLCCISTEEPPASL